MGKTNPKRVNAKVKSAAIKIWDFLKIKDAAHKADAIFILGSSSLLPVTKAAELYKKGFSKKIVFISTGGTFTNPKWKAGEAKTYLRKLLSLGIPKKDILWAELTSNTLDEAKRGIRFMRKKGLNPKKVILVDRPVHQRRAYATFKKQNPKVNFINVSSDEKFHPSSSLIGRLLAEVERLETYAKKGDFERQYLDKDIRVAYKILKSFLN